MNSFITNTTFLLSLLAGCIGAVWALSEIVGEFQTETPRALRTPGAWLLVAVNFLAAALIFRMAAEIAPGARSWLAALAIGLSWPTVFRNISLKLTQPISEQAGNETAAIRLEQAYANVQKLALQLVNSVLTRQRMRLLTRVMQTDLKDLERYARHMSAVSPQQISADFIDLVMQRNVDEDAKKAHLTALLINTFNRHVLDDFIRETKKKELKN